MQVGSKIENIMTDRLDLGGLQIERYITKNYTSRVNQALIRRLFSIFSENSGRGVSTIFRLSIMLHVSAAAVSFHFRFKE